MSDLTISCLVDRTLLSLTALEVNDHASFRLGANCFGGTESYNRNAVTSPFFDGDVLVWKTLQPVEEPFEVYVLGSSDSTVDANLATLVTALKQFQYQITLTMNSIVHTWLCDTQDFTIAYTTTYLAAKTIKVNANIMRQPVPIAGSF